MAKILIKSNPKTPQILDDLEQFLEFCRNYGYKFNEADLYNWKSYAYQQFNKLQQGKSVKNMWMQDSRR
jgi:hypothetical protein